MNFASLILFDKGSKKITFILTSLIFFLCLYSLNYFPTGLNDDDAFFYYTIAFRNLNGTFSSFDGINLTNGYHPFWMMILTTFALPVKLIGINNLFAYSITFSFAVASIWNLILRQASNLFKILIFSISLKSVYGMDTTFGSLLLILIYLCILKNDQNKLNKKYIGFLTFIFIFTRIDFIIQIIFLLFLNCKKNIKNNLFFGLVLGILSNFMFNFILSDHLISISSYLKVSRTNVLHNISSNLSSEILIFFHIVNLIGLFFITYILIYNKTRNFIHKKEFNNFFVLVFSSQSFLFIHFIFSLLRWWYFVPTLMTTFFILNYLIRIYKKPKKILEYLNLSIIFISILSIITSTLIFFRFFENSMKTNNFISEINYTIKKNEKIFVFDTSGILAWRLLPYINVVNGDGLINNFDYYYNYFKDKKNLDNYFKTNKINYYIKNTNGKCPRTDVDQCSDLFMNSKLILSSKYKGETTSFKLFKIEY